MKSCLLLLLSAVPAHADELPRKFDQGQVSVITGRSMPINGLVYNAGIGLRGGTRVGQIYLGGMLAVHVGDTKQIKYSNGVQTYSSRPKFITADAAYEFAGSIGTHRTTLSPYVSAGMLSMSMSSSGTFGDPSLTKRYFVLGGGLSYNIDVTDRYAVGLHARVYNTGDTSFDFGDSSQGQIEHGFSTSIFYAGFYLENIVRF